MSSWSRILESDQNVVVSNQTGVCDICNEGSFSEHNEMIVCLLWQTSW